MPASYHICVPSVSQPPNAVEPPGWVHVSLPSVVFQTPSTPLLRTVSDTIAYSTSGSLGDTASSMRPTLVPAVVPLPVFAGQLFASSVQLAGQPLAGTVVRY